MSSERIDRGDVGVSVTEQASDWWITLNAGEATPQDHDAFRAWAERSPERIEAFLQTATLTRALKSQKLCWPDTPQDELARQAHGAGADVIPLSDLQNGVRSVSGGRASKSAKAHSSTLMFALAASLLGVVVGLWLLLTPAHRYDTDVGELRSVVLEDGSIVTLNTASRIEVKFDGHRRAIELLAGEALFQVARDPVRPFDVLAGSATVRAMGTQFNVDLRPRRTVITVMEGKIAVLDSAGKDASQKRARADAPTYLSAGEQLTLEPRKGWSLEPRKPSDLTVVTAWTQRQLVFDHRPIAEVAEEFNRYNELQIEIEGDELRAEQMTGVFKANDPESFLAFVGRMPGVTIERDTDNAKVRAPH